MNQRRAGYRFQAWAMAAVAALFLLPESGWSWGFEAHRLITRKAVWALDRDLQRQFLPLADSLVWHSIDPDLWRRDDEAEGNRHYIDLDSLDTFPFLRIPARWEEAKRTLGEEQLQAIGIVPWRIAEMVDSLSAAMHARDRRRIVRYAAALAHYVEDIHNPLHTTKNYNGQFSGNDGIHSRYERWMFDRFSDDVSLNVQPQKAGKIDDLATTVFQWLRQSYIWVDNLLWADTMARTPGRRYEKPEDFELMYYHRLYQQTRSFTLLQVSRAATAVASVWQLAWERAGRPDIPR